MRYRILVGCGAVAYVLASVSAPASADVAAETACQDEPDTGAINACFAKVYAGLDQELNAAYKAGLKIIDAAALQPSLARDWRRAYQDAQRKWIAYREADCGPPVSYEWTGGSATSGMQLSCKITRTRERLGALKRRYGKGE